MIFDYSSVIPFFVILPLLIYVAGVIAYKIPFYKKILEHEDGGRFASIDGLRGILALCVFFQHAITHHYFFTHGVWQITDERFYRFLGGEAVIIFFMITSFLYWSKAISKQGNIDMVTFFKSRLLRLAPMYLFSASIIVIVALIITDFSITKPLMFLKDILSWLTLGLVTTVSTNGISIIPINAGIHWTLHFEWIFYLVFPLIVLILRKYYLYLLSIPLLALVYLSPERGYLIIFLFGIIAAHIVHLFPEQKYFQKNIAGLIPLLGLIAVYMWDYKPYGIVQYAITLLIFISFIYGNDICGLLKTRGARFLSTISYSVYLLHGICLYLVLSIVNGIYPIAELSAGIYWLIVLLISMIVILVSSWTYRYIEAPFLRVPQRGITKEEKKNF